MQSATVLVRKAFVREFANGKALGSSAGLCATPYSSSGTECEQGISKAGNRRLRTVMGRKAQRRETYVSVLHAMLWVEAGTAPKHGSSTTST